MAQYWLEIASADDLDQLEVVTTGSLSYTTDGGIPVAVFTSTTAVGEYLRLLSVPSTAELRVRCLYRQVSGAVGASRTGPAARISGGNGYIYGKGATAVYRQSKSVGGVWSEISSNLNLQPAGNEWGWMDVGTFGTTIESRNWLIGEDRPESPSRTATDASMSSGFAGFGAPGASVATAHIRIIAVGTDGDPAPDGPVGGERQRSRLILTPW